MSRSELTICRMVSCLFIGFVATAVACRSDSGTTPIDRRLHTAFVQAYDPNGASTKADSRATYHAMGGILVDASNEELEAIVNKNAKCEISEYCPGCSPAELASFEIALRDALFFELLYRPHHKLLTRFVATACPEFIGQSPIEFELARATLEIGDVDGMMVLLDSLELAEGEAQECLRRSSIRAFSPYVPIGGSVDEWAARCREWWELHRKEMTVNMEYPAQVLFHEPITKASGLFVPLADQR